jgi:hypothetical protein
VKTILPHRRSGKRNAQQQQPEHHPGEPVHLDVAHAVIFSQLWLAVYCVARFFLVVAGAEMQVLAIRYPTPVTGLSPFPGFSREIPPELFFGSAVRVITFEDKTGYLHVTHHPPPHHKDEKAARAGFLVFPDFCGRAALGQRAYQGLPGQ